MDGDWNCLKCGANNFSRRTFCFKQDCKAPKPRDERDSFRGDRRDSGGPHPGDQRGPGGQRGPGDQRGSFRGDRRDSGGPHPGDQRHFGQAQPPMQSPQAQKQGPAPPLPPGPVPNFDNSASQPAKPNNAPPISSGSTKQQEQVQ